MAEYEVGALLTRLLVACSRADRELIVGAARNARDISAGHLARVAPGADPQGWPVVMFWAGVAAAAAAVSAQLPLSEADLADLAGLDVAENGDVGPGSADGVVE